MTMRVFMDPDRRLVEWCCCGMIWQLLLSQLYPERYAWQPTCPVCQQRM
jgi:hypothetical protein